MINLPEKLPDSIEHVIENTAGPITKNIGSTLGDLWFLIFGGISQCAEKRRLKYANSLELFSSQLIKKYDTIPAKKRIEPDMQTAAQALESSKYCIEHENLRTLFVNLLTSTMNSDLSRYTHPSFSDIIKQMSPLDAKNFEIIKDILPIVEYVEYVDKSSNEYITLLSNVFLENSEEHNFLKLSASISSLQRLGLIVVDYQKHITDDRVYEKFESKKPTIVELANEKNTKIIKGIVQPTLIGWDFRRACLN